MLRMKAFPQAGHCRLQPKCNAHGELMAPLLPLGCGPPLHPRRGRQHTGDEMLVDGAPACRLGLYVPAVTERDLSRYLQFLQIKFRDTSLEQRR